MRCSYCGALLAPDSRFCKSCGSTVVEQVKPGHGAPVRQGGEGSRSAAPKTTKTEINLDEDVAQLEAMLHKFPEADDENESQTRIRLKKVRRHRNRLLPHFRSREKGELRRNLVLLGSAILLAILITFAVLRYLARESGPPQIRQGGVVRVLAICRLNEAPRRKIIVRTQALLFWDEEDTSYATKL